MLSVATCSFAPCHAWNRAERVRCCCGFAAAFSAANEASTLVLGCRCRNKLDGPYDNRVMPIVLSATLIVALSITFGSSIVAYEHDS